MRRFIKEPISEVHAAIHALVDAADAHIEGDFDTAAAKFKDANCSVTWKWLNDAWSDVRKNVVFWKPEGDSQLVPKSERDPDRSIKAAIKRAVLERDGYTCRYCGLPVIPADIRRVAHGLYPSAVPWSSRNPAEQHAAFQASWLQYDHVEPHSHGGMSSLENVVISCALCNFGKDRFTLRQLDIEDPRLREPVPSDFDGLERLRRFGLPKTRTSPRSKESTRVNEPLACELGPTSESFFFPGSYISAGYVNVPPVAGKARWFKIGSSVEAEMVERDGVHGCIVRCPRKMIDRRGIDADAYLAPLLPTRGHRKAMQPGPDPEWSKGFFMTPFSHEHIEKAIARLPATGSKQLKILLQRAEDHGIDRLADTIKAELELRGPTDLDDKAAQRHLEWSEKVAGLGLDEAILAAFQHFPLRAEERLLVRAIAKTPGIGYPELVKIRGKGDVGLILGHLIYERLGFFRGYLPNERRMSGLLLHRTEGNGPVTYRLTSEADRTFKTMGVF
ncbi:HNH endonuclease [Thioclava sp. F28-4]|uniref:HNH endonuclease n=1 Tax=Thioclava sp. F28-4 TaxID=1915315 RepID=UPI00143B2780|nr:HNH endonuclease [Thioclava sp. F28-4]